MYKVIFSMILYLLLQDEGLQTSEDETNPPSGDQSCTIQPGTGLTPVQFNNDSNNNIVDKWWTVPDEHCLESQEDTPVSICIQMLV